MKPNKTTQSKTTGTVKVIIESKTIKKEEVVDPDLKSIYLIKEAMNIATPRMRKANLRFVLDKYKIQIS